MKLYLVRHGEAKTEQEDPERGLTDRGREAIEWMAAWASQAGVNADQIRHSGKRRAEQTALILGETLRPMDGVVAISGLAPNDDVRPMARIIHGESNPLMLVGHLPFLGRLAGLLLGNDPEDGVVHFSAGQMVCLVREGDRWGVSWSVAPDQII